jgi:trk system potassium uptake protein TrkA
VSVIDTDRRAFRRLGELSVDRIEGVGYDRVTMQSAGIERAVALAAVTNGDNSNIVVARAGREGFGVPNVFARIYDVRRAAVYERLGIPTVASARLTIEMSMRHLVPDSDETEWIDPTAEVAVIERVAGDAEIGKTVNAVESAASVRMAGLRRLGRGIVATADLVIQDGDVLYVVTARREPSAVDPSGGAA